VLVGKERFSENHAWSEMAQHWPASLAGRVVIEVVSQGQLEARLADGGPPVDVVVPMWSRLPGRAIRAWLVNVARGALLDAAAIAHLNTGHLAGIGLDVFPSEPYPADGPLAAQAHRGNRPHRLPHERLLRCRQPTARRCPRLLPRSSATPGTAQQ
jgi:D-isomer specific 2-hydroxyacid dehydrogenase, NAD binding domain